jgi:hypothetical protein
MALTLSQLITYLEPQIQTEVLDYCAGATTAAEGQARFKHGLATVIAQGIKKYNDEVFPDALVSPVGSVSSLTRVSPTLS